MRAFMIIGLVVLLPLVVIGLSIFFAIRIMNKHRCPNCGSRKHNRTESKLDKDDTPIEALTEWRGFICKECGTEYTTDPPGIIKGLPIILGVVAILIAVVVQIDPKWKLTWFGYTLYVIGPVLIISGIIKLIKKKE